MKKSALIFSDLELWYKEIFANLLGMDFPGKKEIKDQIISGIFEVIDENGSLAIHPVSKIKAPVVKTIPVEAWAQDSDGASIQALLFTRNGFVYMFEILRGDGEPIKHLPSSGKFEVIVLSP